MTLEEIITTTPLQTVKRQTKSFDLNNELSVFQKIGETKMQGFVIDQQNRFLYENLIKWANGSEFSCLDPQTKAVVSGDIVKGIYIAGNTGTGKTMAMEILALYCAYGNFLFKSGEDIQLLAFQNIRTDKICEIYSETGLYSDFSEKRIICFHDLTDEPAESMFMGNRERVMKRILSIRGDKNNQITLITSNIPLAEIGKFYDDRVLSRLVGKCNYFELKGNDRRK